MAPGDTVRADVAKRFGAYEILYELKTGGMGAVLLGRRRGPGAFEQLVAIKTILPEYAKTEAVRAMFLDEAAILARLGHPGVANVHDFGEEGGSLYMVMEYVAGIAFREVADLEMPPAIAARAIAEACRGLHAAHEQRDLAGHVLGVVHRDISPDNLMLGFDGHVKVIDFGIALVKNRQAPVTEFGTVKGKPPYMSPEQVKNETVDRRSDVFSLAVVLWEMLAGQALFDGDSIYAIARAVEHQEIKPPSQVRGAPLPLGLDAVVMNALDRDLARRTPSAAAFAEQLEAVIQTAGDETLEAWAERELQGPREAHRAWLASVVRGNDAPRPVGRATGMITAIGAAAPVDAVPLGKAPTMLAPLAVPAPAPDPGQSTHLPPYSHGDDADVLDRPRRRIALPIVLALVVLGLVGGSIVMLRSPPRAVIVAPADAGLRDATLADAAIVTVPADAAIVPLPADAAIVTVPVDAGHIRTVHLRDAGLPPPRDARHPEPAAPAAPAETGFGQLTAKHTGDTYLLVMVDGRLFGPTPMFNEKLPAGPHTIELVDSVSKDVVARKTLTVHDGDKVSIAPR